MKVLSPENHDVWLVDSVHLLEDRMVSSDNGEFDIAPRGLSPRHDNKELSGTWENQAVPLR